MLDTQTNTNNVNKSWALLQITGGKDEPNIVFMNLPHSIPWTKNQTQNYLLYYMYNDTYLSQTIDT